MKKKSTSQSAFFKLRVIVGILLCFAAITLLLFAFGKASAQPRPPAQSPQPLVRAQYRGVLPVVKFDISPPLRSIKPIKSGPGKLRENEEQGPIPLGPVGPVVRDPVVQSVIGGKEMSGGAEIPGPIITFNAQPNVNGVVPPDCEGTVGPNHIVTMVNLTFQIFDKSGNSLLGPTNNNTIWSGFGGDCQTDNSGDPVALYDRAADRWILSQFTASGPTFFECVAVSTTSDPTGSYFRYSIATGNNFPDYPKAGIWPDAYYFSTREFLNGVTFVGAGAYALNRAQALAGNPNPQVISFLVAPVGGGANVGDGLLPSDMDGATLPPVGSPNFYLGSQDNNGPYGAPFDALNLYRFHADFTNPPNSTFTLAATIPTAPFNSILGLCGGTRACIPQPGTAVKIDHLGYRQRPLFRLAYRNFGDHQSLVTNQSVSAGNGPNGEVSGIRWWEIRDPNGTPVIFQEGTYAPGLTDGIHRWMGSIAMDSQGNIAMGYSASNGSNPAVFPSVRYTGRLAGDPLGMMTLGEADIVTGTGSQTSSFSRWGDYTSLSLDPTDDQTFWHVNEWVPTTSVSGWVIRVGSFKIATSGPITLSARGRKVGGINTVRLHWTGATTDTVDVYRNGVLVVTTANDGSYIDSTGDTGRAEYVYKVCEAGTQTCSNEVTVRFRQ
jgi:hypothetical protein